MSNRSADTDAHPMAGPGRLKEIAQNACGAADVLKRTDIEVPVPGEDDVLAQVFAVPLDTGDHGLHRALRTLPDSSWGWPKPGDLVAGLSVAGIIESVGAGWRDDCRQGGGGV